MQRIDGLTDKKERKITGTSDWHNKKNICSGVGYERLPEQILNDVKWKEGENEEATRGTEGRESTSNERKRFRTRPEVVHRFHQGRIYGGRTGLEPPSPQRVEKMTRDFVNLLRFRLFSYIFSCES